MQDDKQACKDDNSNTNTLNRNLYQFPYYMDIVLLTTYAEHRCYHLHLHFLLKLWAMT